MPPGIHDLDAHEQPSSRLKALYKRLCRIDPVVLEASADTEIDDVLSPAQSSRFLRVGTIPGDRVAAAFARLGGDECPGGHPPDAPVYCHPLMPGLLIVPSLLSPEIQVLLLDRMLHRDLGDPAHATNLHLHYDLPYPAPSSDGPSVTFGRSLFDHLPSSPVAFAPKNPATHKPLSVRQALSKRLHWLTLGGQYDWTGRVYPTDEATGRPLQPPAFPADLAGLLRGLFPETDPQAAIVNVYGTGDAMMVHRDVSEETEHGLVSLSLGCDGLFMICPEDPGDDGEAREGAGMETGETLHDRKYLLLRLRSGDAVYMTGEARCAWHGVPKMLKGTCPDHLRDWPARGTDGPDGAGEDRFRAWRGWMAEKRINFNVRQMTG